MALCPNCRQEINDQTICPVCRFPQYKPVAQSESTPNPSVGRSAQSLAQSQGISFGENIPGLIVLGFFFIIALILGTANSFFYSGAAFRTLFTQLCVVLPLLIGFTLSCRAGGPDFSLLGILTISAYLYAVTRSPVISLVLALLLGALTGALIVFLRAHAVIVSITVAQLLISIATINPEPIMLEMHNGQLLLPLFAGLTLLCLLGGGAYIIFTHLGVPLAQRSKEDSSGKLTLFLAYPLGAFMAALSGICLVLRVSAFAVGMGGWSYLSPMLLIWGALHASRLFDNRWMPVVVAAFTAFAANMMSSALSILGANVYTYQIVQNLFAVLLLISAALAYRKKPASL